MSRSNNEPSGGFTLVELVIGITVLAIVAISFTALFTSLVRSGLVAKRKAIALSLATNQVEYLKSLPYDSLAVAGGSIYAQNPLPATKTEKVDGFTYTIKTSINYIDEAFDGCTSYPTQALKEKLCRNYPPPASQTTNDTNAADYKVINVSVLNASGGNLATVDTQVAARVAETSSTTGALIITVNDATGNPLQGATVSVSNTTITPSVAVGDTTDANGIAIFYNLPPDTNGYDYRITGSKTDYSTLTTLVPASPLQPVYSSQQIFTQASSYVTLTLKPQGPNSLIVEAVNTAGSPLSNMRIYAKGGYKRYTASTDTSYYFDNVTPDTRPTTNASGLATISNLVPGPYYLCGDSGATSCVIGSTTHYLVAAIPYSGSSAYAPINVPTYTAASPPSPLFDFSGTDYYQKARLIFSTSSTFPRITGLSGHEVALSSGSLSTTAFTITGVNLPCSTTPASCATAVRIIQGSNTYTASCTGPTSGANVGRILSCTANLTTISAGTTQLTIQTSNGTYTSPADLVLGSLNVIP